MTVEDDVRAQSTFVCRNFFPGFRFFPSKRGNENRWERFGKRKRRDFVGRHARAFRVGYGFRFFADLNVRAKLAGLEGNLLPSFRI